MQRRQFIRLSGLTTAALFFERVHAETGALYNTLQFPSHVAVLTEGRWVELAGANERRAAGGFGVDFTDRQGVTGVKVSAPGKVLEQVRLGWDLPFAANALFLGDAWERSYGDLQWTGGTKLTRAPWYLLVNEGKRTRGFGVKTGAGCLCSWQIANNRLELVLDTLSGGSGVVLGDRVLHAADIVTIENRAGETPWQLDGRFCRLMCDHPRLPKQPVYGINDWYFAYGNNSKSQILDNTRAMAELVTSTTNRPFSVIDDGWSYKIPPQAGDLCRGDDYARPGPNFGDMAAVAAEIKKIGMRPGLWTRPLRANRNDKATLLTPLRQGESGGDERYLDPTIPANLERVADTIRLYRQWGFELVKHDYSTYDIFGRWGMQMKDGLTAAGWHFNDRSRTNAEIILQLYQAIRHAAGDMYLIGCNTVSHLSAGLFELNRTGDDTSGKEWSRTLTMGVNTMAFRLPQHKTFYAVDGDCVGLTTQIPWEKNKQWLQLLAESGAPLFISAQPEATQAVQKEFIKHCFALAAKDQPTGEPLDWMSGEHPSKWKLNGRVVKFNW